MITFFRSSDCRECDAVEESLAEMCLAYKAVRSTAGDRPDEGFPEGSTSPVLMDDGERFEGGRAIRRHLEELREFKAEWDKFQSDACYCDEQGNVI